MGSYDALLLVSFGGPERPDDVLPFLENVVRGRGVPRERLLEVEAHYRSFGGVSPINDRCRDLIAALRPVIDLPIYWGNRNWHPFLEDTMRQMAADGVEHAAAFITSAYSSYSSCRQYLDDIAGAAAAVDGAPSVVRLRHFYDHPGFIAAFADHTREALARLPEHLRDGARLVFTAHSVPVSMAAAASPWGGGYETQLRRAAGLVADGLRRAGEWRGAPEGQRDDSGWDLVWQSRSGPPQVPWLEPDVCDHLRDLHARGTRAAVLVPIGFVADHVEVLYDLDVEAAQVAAELGMTVTRAATAGVHPRFVSMVRERRDAPEPWNCPASCCPAPRRPGATAGEAGATAARQGVPG
jgi:ferrochelatase